MDNLQNNQHLWLQVLCILRTTKTTQSNEFQDVIAWLHKKLRYNRYADQAEVGVGFCFFFIQVSQFVS